MRAIRLRILDRYRILYYEIQFIRGFFNTVFYGLLIAKTMRTLANKS